MQHTIFRCYSGQASQHILFYMNGIWFIPLHSDIKCIYTDAQSASIIWMTSFIVMMMMSFVFDWQRKTVGKFKPKNSKSNPKTINDTPNRKRIKGPHQQQQKPLKIRRKHGELKKKEVKWHYNRFAGYKHHLFLIIKYGKLLWFFVRLSLYRFCSEWRLNVQLNSLFFFSS